MENSYPHRWAELRVSSVRRKTQSLFKLFKDKAQKLGLKPKSPERRSLALNHDAPIGFPVHVPFPGELPYNYFNLLPEDPKPGPSEKEASSSKPAPLLRTADVDMYLHRMAQTEAYVETSARSDDWVDAKMRAGWDKLTFEQKKVIARDRLEGFRSLLYPLSKDDVAKFLLCDPKFHVATIELGDYLEARFIERLIEFGVVAKSTAR
ncbi:hypothetical protein B0I35DRAFT_431521 [Stachybotrys elegans]|uniref:Uncharacterized protein n=1 Tax=Stachybotrys elegans TaxID=80388 RepID=A0A8K0SUS2_9HYPO|nr:hypothetical protein B0I35DRAFT_431521 [Stachybotrys elegans]